MSLNFSVSVLKHRSQAERKDKCKENRKQLDEDPGMTGCRIKMTRQNVIGRKAKLLSLNCVETEVIKHRNLS